MQIKILVRGYSQEIQWRDEHYVPETINEHLKISGVTIGAFQLVCSCYGQVLWCQVQAQVQGQESWFGLDICFGFLVG